MSLALRVSLVTGTNKGISFANEHDLCQQFSGDLVLTALVLTARDKARGQAAVQQLQAEGLSPRFHLMDTSDIQSIQVLRDFLRKEYGGLDVLVNNAGIAFKAADPTPLHIPAEVTMKTNFFGTRAVCTELLPLMKAQGRVVNVSSIMSFETLKSCSPELQKKFMNETITEEELVGFMNKFVEDTKKGVQQKEGWPDIKVVPYAVSKMGVTVLSRIHARNLSEQRRGDKILLNACCPGWVRTDMGGPTAIKSPEGGAETPVYLALLPSDAERPHGDFLMEKNVEQWGLLYQFPSWVPF
ncbi:LOW QUALITY PROTEIN: carbonyl reductase [NADPH] 1-like [Ursus americanus]|uniref:LOW QUALITY PROTEIN: carbonyl reductase [NADPH] 1-like n=1 Tax=Ursus americanus TaxID=9643 RepID=UPI001E67937A|nr:LOW QUALITY PROTEIN: carbonyl reductase [NADPH] 1-like [Ursus americanus]